MRKLWAYNLVTVETKLAEESTSFVMQAINPQKRQLSEELKNRIE